MAWYNFWQTETKAVPTGVAFSDTEPRGEISKAYFPGFLLKPPFGWPKFKNINELRRLAMVPQAAMAIQTIIDEVVSIPQDIIPREGFTEDDPITQAHIDEVRMFFDNPNSNKESFNHILRLVIRDLLELDSGIIVKEFSKGGQMVQIKSVDAAGFLKNPDVFGKISMRDDVILEEFVNVNLVNPDVNPVARAGGLSVRAAQIRAAYFQFGYLATGRPIPFGKKEIVWIEKNPVGWDVYGRSAVESLMDVLQTLIYSIQYNLEYFEDNNVPKGFIQLAGASEADLLNFQQRWNDIQLKKDTISGRLRKIFHRIPITSSPNAEFKRVQFSAQELELISSQQWFTKLVWSMFGVTPSELGFTEDSNRATEIAQSRVFKRKAILPIINILEYHINKEIISEWEFDDIEYKFITFDIEEETSKFQLYKIQTDTKIKTINEIRRDEGLPDVDWGDEPINVMSGLGLNPVQDGEKPSQAQEMAQDNKEKKALSVGDTTGNVTLGENEVLSQLRRILKEKEKDILAMVKQEARRDRLTQIKSLDTIARKLNEIFNDAMVSKAGAIEREKSGKRKKRRPIADDVKSFIEEWKKGKGY